MDRLSPACYNVDCSQLMSRSDHCQLQLAYPMVEHPPVRNLQHETLPTTFNTYDHSQHLLLHGTNLFLCFSCIFTFLEIIKHNMWKCCLFSSIFNIKMATHQFTNFGKCFLMHADMTAVTIQSNQIVSNEVKDN